jgi:CheY-like chemotaxis protein
LIATDENKLKTLLNNLLSNAIRYTVTGSINLSVRMLDDWIEISVEDTGRGIHPDDQPRIFERYYQTQIKDLSIAGGTGIGLSLCKEIATLLGGDIRVESNWGKGSNFIFTFQAMLLIPEAKQMPAPAEPRPINPDMKATVLIVEDSYDLYKFMAAILQNQYNVIYAANGQAGWDLLEKMRKPDGASGIDMVISDLMMPVKDGYWLIGQIKSDPHFFILPVIVVTARNREDDKLSALRIGLDDYITKPFLEAELSARVETLMLHYKNRRESVRQDESDESDMNPEMVTDWLINLEKLVDERLHEPDFNIDNLSAHMGISSRQLLRKTRQYSGLTSSQFIQEMRMRRAKQVLESLPKPSVKEVSYAVGLRDPKYFSKEFLKRFGILPSDYTASPSSQISPELT